MPRGWGIEEARETTLIDHVNNNITFSLFTSWTTSEQFAQQKAGNGGIVLKMFISQNEYGFGIYNSFMFSEFQNEYEITLFGPRKADEWYYIKQNNVETKDKK